MIILLQYKLFYLNVYFTIKSKNMQDMSVKKLTQKLFGNINFFHNNW